MKQERTLKELYQIVLDNVSVINQKEYGICIWIKHAWFEGHIDVKEFYRLNDHFILQRPSRILYPEFFEEQHENRLYWWGFDPNNIDNVRVRFITHIIANLPESQS